MRLHLLGKGGTTGGGCPSLYVTDRGTYVVQGWRTDVADRIEIPHLLTGFAQPDTFIGASMSDTGRGTFTLAGSPVTDPEALRQMDIYPDETCVEVPKAKRRFYGATRTR
ncbi:hypothetical protein [Nocardia goodfellowii]|uniref:Uncharacterized protein n=1 Tax=Nocardia goodfellowii TaxID=882446 RepID=A0ABS4QR38_9NOCA|nr:hypothetical protein [Nocardia goodfellowii]MBP2194178.1 hypothetical protein [Nocardia goodfellowii]